MLNLFAISFWLESLDGVAPTLMEINSLQFVGIIVDFSSYVRQFSFLAIDWCIFFILSKFRRISGGCVECLRISTFLVHPQKNIVAKETRSPRMMLGFPRCYIEQSVANASDCFVLTGPITMFNMVKMLVIVLILWSASFIDILPPKAQRGESKGGDSCDGDSISGPASWAVSGLCKHDVDFAPSSFQVSRPWSVRSRS
ncbi:hypothetical protein L208DRAFT_560915 [Tricholoma matsutake]|nr:hypothetical protein L208DRAFT_560915 [Tricholoma matsutake 945]